MYRLIAVIILLMLIMLSVFLPATAQASTGDIVIITAQPSGNITCPWDLNITIVSPYEIQLSWQPAGNSTGTLIKAAYGRWPTSSDDGFVVYSGDDNHISHWLENEVMVLSNIGIYYRVWGIISEDNYTACYTSGSVTGGEEVATIGSFIGMGVFSIMTLGLTLGGYLGRKTPLAIAGGAFWLLLAAYAYTQSEFMWDVYYSTFFVSAFMTIVCIFEAVMINRKVPASEAEEINTNLSDEDIAEKETEDLRKRAEKYRQTWRKPKKFKW